MGEKELRELLLERLHIELNLFKDSMLQKEKGDIYEASFKIEVFITIYEILLEDVKELGRDGVRTLIYWKYGILESLYQEWLGREDSFYEELRTFVDDEMRVIAESGKRKEEENGAEESDQAA